MMTEINLKKSFSYEKHTKKADTGRLLWIHQSQEMRKLNAQQYIALLNES